MKLSLAISLTSLLVASAVAAPASNPIARSLSPSAIADAVDTLEAVQDTQDYVVARRAADEVDVEQEAQPLGELHKRLKTIPRPIRRPDIPAPVRFSPAPAPAPETPAPAPAPDRKPSFLERAKQKLFGFFSKQPNPAEPGRVGGEIV